MNRKRNTKLAVMTALTTLLVTASGCSEAQSAFSLAEKKPAQQFVLKGVSDVGMVAQLTGKQSINRTDAYKVDGTDLGIMFDHNDHMYFVFGDTFGPRADNAVGGVGQNWRGNVIAYTLDKHPEDGITFDGMITNGAGMAKELMPGRKKEGIESSKIPTGAFSANGNMYIHYMSVRSRTGQGEWTCNYSGLAKSSDNGQTWTLLDQVQWPGDSHYVQAAAYRVDHDIYFWTLPSGRSGGVRLMKVKETEVEDIGKYVYFKGMKENRPEWSSRMEDGAQIVRPSVGEHSVAWNDYLQRYVMLYLNKSNHMFEMREGIAPWGPWGEPVPVVKQSDYPKSYGPFMHPAYFQNNGETIYFTLSMWDPYNVYWMKATLRK